MSSLPRAGRGAIGLDLACGGGRHARALLEIGYDVVAMDVARTALVRTRQCCAGAAGAGALLLVQADGDDWPFAPASFDAVIQVDFLDRRLFDALDAALRPGGLLLVDTFLDQGRPNADGPSRAEFLLRPGELARHFAAYEVLRDEETRGETGRALFLARKR